MDSKQTKSKRKAGKITPKPKAALEVERSGLAASANPARGVSKATKKVSTDVGVFVDNPV